MWTQTTLRQALEARGLHPRKSLGQHFLVDPNFGRFIVRAAALPSGAEVLEIGAGPGLLTAHLAPAAGRVRAVEIDPAMAALCREAVAGVPNVEMLEQDVLDADGRIAVAPSCGPGDGGGGGLHVFGNLPYNRSVDILVALLSWDCRIEQMVVLVQREVGDRLRARPAGELYGPLSVVAQAFSRVEVLRKVPSGVFWPAPRVESALVRLVPCPERSGRVLETWNALGNLFRQRRKRLANTLESIGMDKARARESCLRANISPEARAESVEPEALLRILSGVS
jgi:16S rRNA (adenine1518-N6/adenine1519-N6)-dimethyltransferase